MEVTEKVTVDAREEQGLPNSKDFEIVKKKLLKNKEKRPWLQTVTSTGRKNFKEEKGFVVSCLTKYVIPARIAWFGICG